MAELPAPAHQAAHGPHTLMNILVGGLVVGLGFDEARSYLIFDGLGAVSLLFGALLDELRDFDRVLIETVVALNVNVTRAGDSARDGIGVHGGGERAGEARSQREGDEKLHGGSGFEIGNQSWSELESGSVRRGWSRRKELGRLGKDGGRALYKFTDSLVYCLGYAGFLGLGIYPRSMPQRLLEPEGWGSVSFQVEDLLYYFLVEGQRVYFGPGHLPLGIAEYVLSHPATRWWWG